MNNILKKTEIPFTMVANKLLNDNRLSFKAKGIYAYLSSKPDNWQFYRETIFKETKGGEDSFYSGIKELEQYNYIKKYQPNINGKFHAMVYELLIPDLPCRENPRTDLADREKPGTYKEGYNNNTDINNKDSIKKESNKEKKQKELNNLVEKFPTPLFLEKEDWQKYLAMRLNGNKKKSSFSTTETTMNKIISNLEYGRDYMYTLLKREGQDETQSYHNAETKIKKILEDAIERKWEGMDSEMIIDICNKSYKTFASTKNIYQKQERNANDTPFTEEELSKIW